MTGCGRCAKPPSGRSCKHLVDASCASIRAPASITPAVVLPRCFGQKTCRWCGRLFAICPACDRGHAYGAARCRTRVRRRSSRSNARRRTPRLPSSGRPRRRHPFTGFPRRAACTRRHRSKHSQHRPLLAGAIRAPHRHRPLARCACCQRSTCSRFSARSSAVVNGEVVLRRVVPALLI